MFPTHNSVSVKGIFDCHLRFEDPNDAKRNKGDPKGTLLKSRLCEVSDERDDNKQQLNYKLDNLPIKRAVFIDSTWNQCRAIFKDERLKRLRPIILQNRLSQFWRHQKGSPRWYLATIEGKKKIWTYLRNCDCNFVVDSTDCILFLYSRSSAFDRNPYQRIWPGQVLSSIRDFRSTNRFHIGRENIRNGIEWQRRTNCTI